MKTPIFTGAAVAIITPMLPDGSVDYKGLADLIEFQIKGGTDAVVICGFRLRDMTAEMLAADLQGIAPLLVISSPGNLELCSGENLFKLATPATRADFFASLDLLLQFGTGHGGPPAPQHSRPQRSEAEERLVRQAKAILMEVNLMTEAEAHRFLQKRSMDAGLKLADTARLILEQYSR